MSVPARLLALVCVAVLSVGYAPSAHAETVPPGYEVASSEQLADGVTHLTLTKADPPQVVHVARTRSSSTSLRVVLGGDRVTAPLERTSSMCRRVSCLAAVNGDFFHPSADPVGGVVRHGELIRSPNAHHHQLLVGSDGGLSTGQFRWTATLASTDLRHLRIDGVNIPREADQIVLYTDVQGTSTGTNPHGVEVTATIVEPAGPLRLGQTSVVELHALRESTGDTALEAGRVVLSGHGEGARKLQGLWDRLERQEISRRTLVRVESEPDVVQSLGGTPILVRDGRPWFTDRPSAFVRGRHPRTIVGWTAERDVLLVTVDGRQPGRSVGMSLAEAADLMIGLGATEALNLDGGGSTTFVVGGEVRNVPSDRVLRSGGATRITNDASPGSLVGHAERPVAVALALVPRSGGPAGAYDPLAVPLEMPVALPVPLDEDPASDPHSALPALLPVAAEAADTSMRLTAAALAALALALALAVPRRPTRPRAAA